MRASQFNHLTEPRVASGKRQSLQPRLQCLTCPNQFLTQSIQRQRFPTTPPPHRPLDSPSCSLCVSSDPISNRPAFTLKETTLLFSLHKCPPPAQYPNRKLKETFPSQSLQSQTRMGLTHRSRSVQLRFHPLLVLCPLPFRLLPGLCSILAGCC